MVEFEKDEALGEAKLDGALTVLRIIFGAKQ